MPAGLIYKYKRTRLWAFIGAVVGSFFMATIGLLLNYYITYPMYAKVGMPMSAILGLYRAIYPKTANLWQALSIFNMPFTFVKGLLNTIICMLIYKP
ncbi:MAG: ECF transporter S component, partial [Clostridia bacterium]